MNEFTLTADFGMTASDNGFIQYGIHPGDTIMFKKAEDFPVNGSIVAVIIDDGPITPVSYTHLDVYKRQDIFYFFVIQHSGGIFSGSSFAAQFLSVTASPGALENT